MKRKRITISKFKTGQWLVDTWNGLEGYEWGGTWSFHDSWQSAWKQVFGVNPNL